MVPQTPGLRRCFSLLELLVVMALISLVLGLVIPKVGRLPRGLGINSPRRSFCPNCKAWIQWYDNIPILSFLVLRARCRACDQPISWRYPMVELITGLLFALVYFRQGVQLGTDPGQLAVMMLVGPTAALYAATRDR